MHKKDEIGCLQPILNSMKARKLTTVMKASNKGGMVGDSISKSGGYSDENTFVDGGRARCICDTPGVEFLLRACAALL